MAETQASAISLLKIWFDKAEKWQKDLFCQVRQGNEDVEKLTTRAFSLAKVEYLGENSKFASSTTFPTTVEFSNGSNCPVILKSISEVQGVGALSPTRPLEFGNNLTIVYGENGCGKSSYVRILKSAVSPKNADAILSNVYEPNCQSPQALLTYSDDGEEHQIHWKPSMKSTCPLNIYDTSVAKQFAEEKNEVIYEPHILSILSTMATVYEGVKTKFDELGSENLAQQTPLDKAISNHKLITDFYAIKTIKAYDQFISDIIWDISQQMQLSALQEGLQNQDPSKQLKVLKAQRDLVEKQYQVLIDLITKTGDSFSDEYLSQRKAQIDTKQNADHLIEELKKVSIISKTGSDNWKKMWATAVKFSQESTSKSSDTIIVDGKCILCQQDISEDANTRIAEFYRYMTSTAIKQSEETHLAFENTVEQLKTIYSSINIEQIESVLRASSVEDDIIKQIIEQYKTIKSRCKWLLEYTDDTRTSIPVSAEIKSLQDAKDKILTDYSARIKALQDIIANRDKQIVLVNDLLASKWINDNKLIRKKDIQVKIAISNCKTNALTSTKKDLTHILITNTYISRFEEEMCAMDCNHKIKVELISKAEKGKSYHQVALRGAVQKKKTGEVLSEGEFRVVSLAAFLADLSSWNKVLPFIFDDPITSLDHKYEKMVAKRLVSLSNERQVIVFTHRLAFVQLLVSCTEEYNKEQALLGTFKKVTSHEVELRNEPLGEPVYPPTYNGTIKMSSALKNMKQNELTKIKKLYANQDYSIADNYLQAICARFRNLIEQGIEMELLSKVVTRFDYSIKTKCLRYLHIITDDDINLFEEMMTRYSYFDHSQSVERPVSLPSVDDVEKDIDRVLAWSEDFKKRYNNCPK
ncbi:MAG: hypothetical protein NC485_00910 [Ruminococcus flavefaciens]|nr:hypothetical protein [Ruminococcus flavefaciens]MCM1058782.1 hypothetical protein [Eubacterium sp.]